MDWETVVGLEVHVELATRSKMFCGCEAAFGRPPNSCCCPVCAGLPGALPSLNGRAVELAVTAALALGCEVERNTRFDRKNYCYPDLPKAYQISQLYLPLGRKGRVELDNRCIGIHELHMEEDAGKLSHGADGLTRIDFNRSGVPLIEIVTEPELHSGEEAVACLEHLREVLRATGVSDCRMEEGSLRCDVNLSVRPAGSRTLGTRTEMKNLGSFRAVAQAIGFESSRQMALLEGGGQVERQTLRWDEQRGEAIPLRGKETAADYRYFPEPDLPPLVLEREWVEGLRARLPELPAARRARYRRDWGLSGEACRLLTSHPALSAFFEELVALGTEPGQGAKWLLGPVLGALHSRELEPDGMALRPSTLACLLARVSEGRLSRPAALQVLEGLFDSDGDVDAYVQAHGLEQSDDPAPVTEAVAWVLAQHPGPAADYRAGKGKALGFLVGQVMRRLGSRADPALVNRLLKQALEA